ncbi:MAG: monooxygenase [Actinoplanes sp.]
MLRMAVTRRRRRGVHFAKFLGTSSGFGPDSPDWTRYAAVTVSDHPVELPAWDRLAVARCRVDIEPLSSRGTWSGREPFGTLPVAKRTDGMMLALTRARLRPTKALTFWRAIPPVAREAVTAPGLLAHFGMGEAPIGWQGTVSVWRHAADLTHFAYRQPEHRAVIARTPADRWYAEELFARFAVRDIQGDRTVLGWVAEESETEQ